MTERCEDCRFWSNSSTLDGHDNTGRCRRRAPVADDRTGHARWAYTEDVDWCGEFETGRLDIAEPLSPPVVDPSEIPF